MVKKAKQEMSFSKAKQRGMVWVRAMHKYNQESMGVAPGPLHPHRTFDDTSIRTQHTDSHFILFIFLFFPRFAQIRADLYQLRPSRGSSASI